MHCHQCFCKRSSCHNIAARSSKLGLHLLVRQDNVSFLLAMTDLGEWVLLVSQPISYGPYFLLKTTELIYVNRHSVKVIAIFQGV